MEVNTELTKLNINNFTVSVRLNIPKEYSNAMIIANGAGANMDSLL